MTAEIEALQILKRISEVIASNDDIGAVFSEIVNILAERLETDVCSIYVLDEEKNDLVLAATCGLNRDLVGEIRLEPGDGITGAAFMRHEVINVASAAEHKSYRHFGDLGEDRYKSFLSSPLLIGSRAVGVLNLQRLVEEKFPDEIVDMVNSLSTQIANLVLSAKMLKALSSLDEGVAKGSVPPVRRQQMHKGIVANSGIAVGRACVYQAEESLEGVDPATDLPADQEIDMLEKALRQARKETVELEEVAVSLISEADASIFDVHLMILEDKSLIESVRESISKGYSLEYAIKHVNSLYQGRFRQMEDEIFRDKAADFKDVMLRLLKIGRALKRGEALSDSGIAVAAAGEVVVARELLPSEVFRLASANILGIITEKGSRTSHVAVLAKALNIPALLGVKNLVSHVREDDTVILDCNAGLCYINPDDDIRSRYEEILKAQLQTEEDTDPGCGSGTADGTQVFLRANIS
ncbi:MAG: GAF domain-containing protein, partial [Victivallales bacterium]|nr:GAF domain-containing protein [Victivallales bacterium]